MVVGQLYAFVHAREDGNSVSHYTMGGMFDDSYAAARRLGHDLDSVKRPKIEMLLATPDAGPIVTIHMDRWFGSDEPADGPALVYWRECLGREIGWDRLHSYLGPEKERDEGVDGHVIVVPSQHWDDDPRLHVSSWSNPNDVVKRILIAEDAVGWEQKMRARTHAAMAKALGF